MSTQRADAIVPGNRIRRKRLSGTADAVTVVAVRRLHEGSVTRFGFDTQPNGDFLGWFTPGAPIHLEG